jgi:hypothetical protein
MIHEFLQKDVIFLIWLDSATELCRFHEKFGTANDNIKLEWQGTPSTEEAINPAKFDRHQHHQVHFLDLDITVLYSPGSEDFAFKVYRKQRYCLRLSALRIIPREACLPRLAQGRDAQAADIPIQKVTEIYNKVTEIYKKVTELEISSWNALSLLRSAYPILKTFPRFFNNRSFEGVEAPEDCENVA